ncbi:MAG: cytochrome c3 family protein [Deltaproteobacteria bacterium]|nr:cytochrome c3 family protein [Deltaproteobacteria bacterium]
MKKIFALLFTGFLIFLSSAIADQNKGAEKMEIYGGKKGKVHFPHRRHQKNLVDCNKCHDMFPQLSGTIENMKTEGKLKKKAVMNKLCLNCHRVEKKAGRPFGPLKCSECHVK